MGVGITRSPCGNVKQNINQMIYILNSVEIENEVKANKLYS